MYKENANFEQQVKFRLIFLDGTFLVYLPRALDAFMDAKENSNPRDKQRGGQR